MKNMWADRKEFFSRHFASITASLIFLVYLTTMAPGVVQIDAGELAAVQSTLGIAHPTGYPLFTIAGYLFLKIPLPFTVIFRANLLAALWCVLAIALFVKSAFLILSNSVSEGNNEKGKTKRVSKGTKEINPGAVRSFSVVSSVCGGIAMAFSRTFWIQSTSVEVYSLQAFLFSLIIFLILRAYYSNAASIAKWLWVALALALGFANHMTTLLLLPFISILFFQREKIKTESFKKIFFMLLIFIPVLILFYLYLPLRASGDPVINWGNPVNLENILRHISGKQYQVWLFASMEAAGKQFKYFLSNFPSEFAYVGLLFGLTGIAAAYRISRIIFSALLATFLFTILYSINYDIVDIDSYFLLAYIMFAFFVSFGFFRILNFIRRKWNFRIAVITVSVIILLPMVLNYSRINQHDVHTFEDYTKAVLNSTEKNSIIFSYQWDYLVSPSYYFQFVENYRPDVAVIDKELLRRSWFYNQLKRNYPDVMKNIITETENFFESVRPFERGEQFDADLIETHYRTLMTNLVAKNIDKHNYYIGPEIFQNEVQRGEFALPEGYGFVPYLLMFKVSKGNEYVPAPDPDFTIRFPENRNKYIDFIETMTATMLTYRAAYELQFNKPERAKIYIGKIRKDFPEYQIPYEIRSRIK